MRILGGELTENGKSWIRMIVFSIITVIAVITAILSSFMVTEAGTKEHNWWVFLMVISWVAFGGTALATGVSIYSHVKRNRPATAAMPSTAPIIAPTEPTEPAT